MMRSVEYPDDNAFLNSFHKINRNFFIYHGSLSYSKFFLNYIENAFYCSFFYMIYTFLLMDPNKNV